MRKLSEQEIFWAGKFGEDYINRNISKEYFASNLNFFASALKKAPEINSLREFGANVGMNLRAIRLLFPNAELSGVEINSKAAEELKKLIGDNNVFEGSILDADFDKKSDVSLIKGVLIHINPDLLNDVYVKLYSNSSKYILIAEYYNPVPVVINYRGHENKLFKRDFAGEFLDKFPDAKLIDYGFVYRRDPNFPQDDITWFLIEKK